MNVSEHQKQCIRGEEIGAYLDGELSTEAQTAFETHLGMCPECAAELSNQKGLLRTLDLALTTAPSMELPANFSEVVALRAESDLGGLRTWQGGARALGITAGVGLCGLLLLALGRGDGAPKGIKDLALGMLGLLDIFSRLVFDLVFGLVVVLRAAGRWLVHSPSPLGFLSVLLFIVATLFLVRQVKRFHRA